MTNPVDLSAPEPHDGRHNDCYPCEVVKLQVEIDRLRAALERIGHTYDATRMFKGTVEATLLDIIRDIEKIAREALSGERAQSEPSGCTANHAPHIRCRYCPPSKP